MTSFDAGFIFALFVLCIPYTRTYNISTYNLIYTFVRNDKKEAEKIIVVDTLQAGIDSGERTSRGVHAVPDPRRRAAPSA